MRKGIAYTVLGTIIVILLTALAVVLTGLLSTGFLSLHHPGEPVVGLLLIFTPCVIACFVLLEGVLILTSQDGPAVDRLSFQKPKESEKKKKSPLIWYILVLVVVLLLVFVCSNVFVACSDTGITYHYLFVTHSYSWEDVTSYTVSDSNGVLSFTLKLSGGKTLCLSGYSTSETKAFNEKYGSMLYYYADIDRQLEAAGRFKTVKVSESCIDSYRNTEDWDVFAELTDQAS